MDPSDTLTPEAASAQRAELMADAGFRQRAAAGGAEWQQIAALDRAIAAVQDEGDESTAAAPVAEAKAAGAEGGGDGDAFEFSPPASASGYALPLQEARSMGLAVDFAVESELKTALHTAGVDVPMAQLLYTAAMGVASRPPTPVQAAGERHTSEAALRRVWGGAFDANLAAAKAEARRVFDAMPASATGGATFADYCQATGLGNSKVLIEAFYQRAQARR